MCTSVASRVHGHHRRAVLERAVVAEDDVQHGGGEVGREARAGPRSAGARGSSRARSRPGACRRRSCRSRAGRPCRRRACRCRAAARRMTATSRSMPGKVAEIAETAWATVERVLEQPVAVGLVVALGGRRVAERGARSRDSGPNTASSSARRWRFWTVADELAQVGLHLRRRRAAGRRAARPVDLVGARGRSDRTAICAPWRGSQRVAAAARAPATPRLARPRRGRRRRRRRPRRRARAVAEHQAQDAPPSRACALALAHQQDAVDVLAVGELAHDHGRQRRSGPDGWRASLAWIAPRSSPAAPAGSGARWSRAFADGGWRVVVLDVRPARAARAPRSCRPT